MYLHQSSNIFTFGMHFGILSKNKVFMKKLLLAVVATVCLANMAGAQKKYDKLFYKDIKKEGDDIDITVQNAVSTEGETKLKLKITNKTNDFIIYKPEESHFVINGKEYEIKEKQITIDPNSSDFKIINLKGEGFNAVRNYSYMATGIYKVPTKNAAIPGPDFRLPPSKNSFDAGPFSFKSDKVSKDTKKTTARFDCSYNGNKVGLIFPDKIAVRMPDGNDYANAKSKPKPILLTKGGEDYFTLEWDRMEGGGRSMDMQFAEMIIKWNDAFSEATPVKVEVPALALEIDETASK